MKRPRRLLLILLPPLALATALLFGYRHEPSAPEASRFIKLDSQGAPLAPWQGPWSCVYDSQTQLVWENKTDDESIHDALWTYSWYRDGAGVSNGGDCYFEKDRCDTDDLLRRANREAICGISDWRLPTLKELSTLVKANPKTGMASIHNDYFLHTKRGDYWSQDHRVPLSGVYAHLGEGALALDFITGEPRVIPYRNAAFVRLVSSSQPAAIPSQ